MVTHRGTRTALPCLSLLLVSLAASTHAFTAPMLRVSPAPMAQLRPLRHAPSESLRLRGGADNELEPEVEISLNPEIKDPAMFPVPEPKEADSNRTCPHGISFGSDEECPRCEVRSTNPSCVPCDCRFAQRSERTPTLGRLSRGAWQVLAFLQRSAFVLRQAGGSANSTHFATLWYPPASPPPHGVAASTNCHHPRQRAESPREGSRRRPPRGVWGGRGEHVEGCGLPLA